MRIFHWQLDLELRKRWINNFFPRFVQNQFVKAQEPSYNVKMLIVSCKNIQCNSWQSHHCEDFICRNSPWRTPMPQYTVECIPWQYVQAVFRRTQKAVTLDCFQRRLSGPMAWGGRCPSLAPQPKKQVHIHVMSLKWSVIQNMLGGSEHLALCWK